MATGPYRLHVAVDRGHGPVYVLLHGINSTGHDWDTVVTAMGFDRRCIAVDELGYGQSPKPLDIEYTIDDHVEALRFTLRDIGVTEPFTIVGYSMGGPIALRYAATHGDEIKRLILISAPFFLKPEEIGDDAYAKAVFQSEGSQQLLNMVTSTGFAKSGVFKKLSGEDKQVIQGFINSQDLKTDWAILQKNMANVIQGPDFPADLVRVKAPITFMVGEHDAFIVQSQIETLRQKFAPNMEIRFLADLKADHMLLENVPTLIAGEITKWEDRRLAVALDRGEGETYVMLHGIENDGSFWNGVGAALAVKNRAISLDLLGFGHSPRPLDIAYSVDDQVASIHATLDSLLGKGARFTLVGHSLGALIAAGYARRFPEQVKRLVLFAPPINLADVEAGGARLDQARAAFVDSFGALRAKGARLASHGAVRGVLGHERLERYVPSMRSLENAIEAEVLTTDLLAVESIPVTVVHGTRDPFVVPEYAAAIGMLRPGIDIVTVDAGHDIAHLRPLEALAAIDPDLDPVASAVIIQKAKTDRKLRPATGGLSAAFGSDALLVAFRGLVYLAFGISLVFLPRTGELAVLRLAFAVMIFARSLSTITSLFTTSSIRQERLTSAAMGFVGLGVGVFLMLADDLARTTLVVVVASYLMGNGAIDLFAAYHTSHSSSKRMRLMVEGWVAVVAGLLLLAGSMIVARLIILVMIVASVAAGVSLLSYALVMRKTRTVWGGTIAAKDSIRS